MTTNPTSIATRCAHLARASVLRVPPHVLMVGALALVTGTALHAFAVPPPAIHAVVASPAAVSEVQPARPAAADGAAPVARDDQGDDEDDEDGAQPEPQLEQIPVAPAYDPEVLRVRYPLSGKPAYWHTKLSADSTLPVPL